MGTIWDCPERADTWKFAKPLDLGIITSLIHTHIMNWKLTFTRPWYMTKNLVVTSHPSQKASTSFWFHLFFPSTWHLAQIPAIPHNTLTRAAENTSPNHRNTFQTVCIRKHYPICVLGATPRSIFAFWHWIFFFQFLTKWSDIRLATQPHVSATGTL